MASASRRKQRKRQANAPLHKRQDMVSIHVSKDLRKTVGRRSLRAKSGYAAKIMRGRNKGKEAKITRVSLKMGKVALEGISAKKADGKEVPLFLDPSNLLLTALERESPKESKKQV